LRGSEAERKRIAQELHDEPIQALIHLCRTIDQRGGELTELRVQATSVTEELRRIAQNLRPPTLDDLGLVAALHQLGRELEQRAAIKVQLEVDGAAQRLNSEIELGLFRIAQEAFRNVERHAKTNSIVLYLTFSESAVELRVQDLGAGFESGANWTRAGALGLIGMRERASLLGGELSVHSTPGQGTNIRTVIPI
ncbi:MAG: sensor histidine kinase, partial [Candidatus Dormibacteraceae bacterium]